MVSTHLPRSDLYSVLKDTLIWGEVEVISLDFTVCYSVTVFLKKKNKRKFSRSSGWVTHMYLEYTDI